MTRQMAEFFVLLGVISAAGGIIGAFLIMIIAAVIHRKEHR